MQAQLTRRRRRGVRPRRADAKETVRSTALEQAARPPTSPAAHGGGTRSEWQAGDCAVRLVVRETQLHVAADGTSSLANGSGDGTGSRSAAGPGRAALQGSGAARGRRRRGRRPRRAGPGCTGGAGASSSDWRRSVSTTRPAYMTASVLADAAHHRQVVAHEYDARDRGARRRSSRRSSTCACTVTSSAVVGSSQRRTSGSDASAIAIMTRWRMPPESWCG